MTESPIRILFAVAQLCYGLSGLLVPEPRAPSLIAQAVRPVAVATLQINAPDRVPAGVGVALNAAAVNVKGLTWGVIPIEFAPYLVQIVNRDDEVNPAIFLYGIPGSYTFICAGIGDGRAVMDLHTVVVGQGPRPVPPGPVPPGPGPGPDPGPTPPPDPTPDRFNLARDVVTWAQSVNDPAKVANAQKFASVCDGLVAQIGAGTLTTEAGILAAFEEAFGGIPLATKIKWRPALLKLQDRLQALKDSGQLEKVADYTQAFSELSAGLKAVR